jgi:hypothetical protein
MINKSSTDKKPLHVRKPRKAGKTVPEIMRQTDLSKASVYRALGADKASRAN